MKYKKTTLPNGLRIITVPMKDNPSVTVMVLVETGSNYETKEQNGLSHFLEHMVFKGTKNRPSSLEISRELETMGASNNAFTDHEVTGYHAKASKKHFEKILEVVSDLYLNPLIPAPELEKERGVILQEISMYEDHPEDKVGEELWSLLYGDTPAGRPIIGPASNIKKFSREEFVKYREKHYISSKTIVLVSGDVEEKKVVSLVKKNFKDIPLARSAKKEKIVEKQSAPAMRVHKKKTDQTHMLIGFRAFPARDKRMPALALLNTILGRGMSSRLFQKMREELGACYYVYSTIAAHTDHGVFIIATGIEAKRSVEVIEAILSEVKRIKEELVSKEELDKAKEYFIGRLYMGIETSDRMAGFYADQEIAVGDIKTPEEQEKEIRKITAKDVQKVAREIFKNEKMNLAVVGDIKNEGQLKKVLTF